MNDQTKFKFEEKIKEAMNDIKPDPLFKNNLWQQIVLNHAEKSRRKPVNKKLQAVLITLLVVFIVGIAVTLIGPRNIALAFSKLQGYVPGIGFVQSEEQVLYLEQPISIEKNGIILTIDQVWADENNVVVNYKFTGLQDHPTCSYIRNILLLPNGKELLPTAGGSIAATKGAQKQIYFSPLPQGISTFTLVVENENASSSGCNASEEWQIDLALKPLPADETLQQVLQGDQLQVTVQNSGKTEEEPAHDKSYLDPSNVTFGIDKVAVLDESYVVAGHFDFSNPDPKNSWITMKIEYQDIHVTDSLGKRIPIEESDNDSPENNGFVFKFDKDNYENPISIEFQSAIISVHLLNGDSFSFEAGQHPEVGQTWQIDQKINLIEHELNVDSVTAFHNNSVSDDPNQVNGYAIKISQFDFDILFIEFSSTSSQIHSKEVLGNIIEGEDGSWTLELTYPKFLPKNEVTYKASRITTRISHPWVLEMELP